MRRERMRLRKVEGGKRVSDKKTGSFSAAGDAKEKK